LHFIPRKTAYLLTVAAVMSFKRKILLPLLVMGITLFANSQDNINFTSLTIKDGLSSNTVTSILKDHYGFMWFGTEDGLDKFDGTNFKVYRYRPNDSLSLQTNEILSLYEDPKGNLWVATSGGSLSLYDRKKDAFINFPAGEKPGLIANSVVFDVCSDFEGRIWVAHYSGVNIVDPKTKKASDIPLASNPGPAMKGPANVLFEDSKHLMWIGTADGLFQYNPATKILQQFVHSDRNLLSLVSNNIRALAEDHDGNIWIGTYGGLSMLKKGANQFVNYLANKSNPNSLNSNAISSIALDDEKLWIATDAGINILDIRTQQIQTYSSDDRNVNSLTARSGRCLYIDKQGICWFATNGGGVNKYDKNLSLFSFVKSNSFDQKGLNTPVVSSFAEDGDGNIFVGTEGGNGLSLFNRKTRLFQHFNIRSSKKGAENNISVLTLAKDKSNQLVLGTYGDGVFVFDKSNKNYRQLLQGPGINDLNSDFVFCIKRDHSGNLWVGTNGDGINVLNKDYKVIARYTPNPKLPNDRQLPLNGYIRDIVEDKTGNIWIATHGGGIAVLNTTNTRFTIYNTRNSHLPNDKVITLHEDHLGNIWAGTFGNGVAMLNPKTNEFICFSESNGLQNNTVYKILEDDEGHIWVSTNKAISSIDIGTKKITNYGSHNGVQNNNFVGGAGLVSSAGEIFFGGLEGFNYFNPSNLKRSINVSPVLLTDLKISNQSVVPSSNGPIKENISIAKEINLDYKQNFALSFVGLNYTSPEQNQYAYKLEGFDKEWNYVGRGTTASYTNLDPGEYVFRVKVSNSEGIWNNEDASIKIYVHPPLWRTTFAYVLYACVFISGLFYLRYRSIKKLRKEFLLEQQQKEEERVRELDRLKIKFLTNLSHEFRTPISLILGPVDTLLKQQNEKTFGQLQMIKRNARRLLNLVNQLLDFRKMEEQELKLQESEGELVSFIKETSDSFKDLSERKKISFVFKSHIDQLYTRFDHDKLERIIFNVLSNAFKFTLEGGKISLELERVPYPPDQYKAWVSIKISDTGIGIPQDKKEKIFDRFFQNLTATSVLNQGTGIGLSITKEFVQMHGGNIEVESEHEKGTTFFIHLPFTPTTTTSVATSDDKELLQEPEPHETTQGEKQSAKINELSAANGKSESPLILLVEDNEDFRFYLKDNLRLHHKVVEASDGRDGWQKALSQHPQLIVTDISMPHMNGIELTRKIKSDKRTSHIPVILLTALTGEKEQIQGLETGANDYITKPFNFEVLNAKINNLLTLNTTLKKTYTKQIKVLSPEIKIESDDEKLLNAIMVYLDENLTNPQLSVEDLGKHVGMSRSSLYNKILELTGQTPVEFIRSVKLDKAAVLLEKSSMNIAQIAYSTGFSTPHYFTKSFKAKFGMLPSEFVTKMRKKSDNAL
jgi:signal transduction histidine kinase/ligand-binding sensor domain-containing protein/DNA-binding response OmpR family regulator